MRWSFTIGWKRSLGIEHRHPYYDRRRRRVRRRAARIAPVAGGEAKYLLRRAAAPYALRFARQPREPRGLLAVAHATLAVHGAGQPFAALADGRRGLGRSRVDIDAL